MLRSIGKEKTRIILYVWIIQLKREPTMSPINWRQAF